MKEQAAYRRSQQRIASREAGVAPGQDRVMTAQAGLIGNEGSAAGLPVIPTDKQFADDSGNRIFMVDMDPVDGGLPIG
jgi:hypothetical protein